MFLLHLVFVCVVLVEIAIHLVLKKQTVFSSFLFHVTQVLYKTFPVLQRTFPVLYRTRKPFYKTGKVLYKGGNRPKSYISLGRPAPRSTTLGYTITRAAFARKPCVAARAERRLGGRGHTCLSALSAEYAPLSCPACRRNTMVKQRGPTSNPS